MKNPTFVPRKPWQRYKRPLSQAETHLLVFFQNLHTKSSEEMDTIAPTSASGSISLPPQRASTRSSRKAKSKINKPKNLVDNLTGRTPSKKLGDGVNEAWKEDHKETMTFFHFFKPENREKNAKPNAIWLYDSNRVILEGSPDYYHASWVDGNKPNQYILAQAPFSPATQTDFFRLVAQYKPDAIVLMGTSDSEEGKMLLPGTAVTGTTTAEESKSTNVDVHTLTTGKHKTKVYCVNAWTADKPTKEVLDGHAAVRKAVPFESKLVIFVCKDGATRAGSFCLLDMEAERIKTKKRIRLAESAKCLRLQRSNAIDTYEVFEGTVTLLIELARKA